MTRAMTATGDWTVAKDFAAWKDRVRAAWPGIRIAGVDTVRARSPSRRSGNR